MFANLFVIVFLLGIFFIANGAITFSAINGLTCQGSSYNQGLSNCPDSGNQKMSIGGNVTIFLRNATNLLNLDSTGPSSMVSDPYVKFTIGNIISKSSVVRNNLNPVWNEYVNIGLLGSATEVLVEIWDADSGLEFSDDLIASQSLRVPFCSTFYANYSSVDCGEPFGCESDDSLWAMPIRQQCNETGFLNIGSGKCISIGGSCVFFDVLIVPFTMKVEAKNTASLLSVPLLSAVAEISSKAKWTRNFGYPFLYSAGSSTDLLNAKTPEFKKLQGALMFQIDNEDKAKGIVNSVKFYGGVNFPAYIYVCRDETDNKRGVPSWLAETYDSRNSSIYQLQLVSQDSAFACYYFISEGTKKNKWGGVIDGALPFRSNTIPGHDRGINTDGSFYDHMYIVVAIPRVIAERDDQVVFTYDSGLFIESFFSYGLIWAWFMFLVANFLNKISFRFDRISSYLVTRVLTGEDKNVLAVLFLTYGQSPSNIQFRAHLFHAENAIKMIILIPSILLFAWGFSCASVVRPAALGFGIAFLGNSGVFLWAGFRLWECCNWRLGPVGVICVISSVLLFSAFVLSVVFLDPAVVIYGHSLNFAALSLVFGTFNTFPLLLLIFKQDRTYKTNLKSVITTMADSVAMIKDTGGKKTTASQSTKPKDFKANKILHALLNNSYTINPAVPYFKFATVLQDLPRQYDEDENGTSLKRGDDLYNFSMVILLIYFIIALVRTNYRSLAFLNCLTLILLDGIHTSIARGNVNWSPGYKISLLVIGRMLVMGSGGSLWLLYYSIVYFVYSMALIREMINKFLPMLSKRQANEAVFAVKDEEASDHPDISGSTFFCMGMLTFAFISILLIASYGGTNSVLLTPSVNVWGAKWPVHTFGIISIAAVVTGGLFMATLRAFYLQKHGLLRGWPRTIFLVRRSVDSPVIFGIFTEISVLASGILIYGVTRCNAVLSLCIFLPIALALLGHAYRTWVKNEYDLVVWPPKPKSDVMSGDSPTDLEVAFHMIENLFGEETKKNDNQEDDIEAAPQEKTLKGFKLPTLDPSSAMSSKPGEEKQIKMPPLPLKSVLRRKRQSMGIKVKPPLIKDLRAREGALDNDRFGNEPGDVLDVNDPWAKFEINEEDDTTKTIFKKKKTAIGYTMASRSGFMSHPYIVAIRDFIKNSKSCQYIIKITSDAITSTKKRAKKYSKVVADGLKGDNGDDDDLAEDEEGGEGKKVDPESGEDIDKEIPESENFAKMAFWKAVLSGYLTKDEYYALLSWFGGLFFVMVMGISIADNNRPDWLGHVIWVAIVTFILTAVPIIKYYNTFIVDGTMKLIIRGVALFHFLFCICLFAKGFSADIGLDSSLWMLDYFLYFPIFLYIGFEFYRWVDDGFKIEMLDKDGDGTVTTKEFLMFFKAYPIIFAMMIILNFHFYVWVSTLFGQIFTLVILVVMIGYLFVRDWALNDFFLSPELSMIGNFIIQFILFITICVSLFSSQNPIFSLSVFFMTFIFKFLMSIIARVVTANPDTIIYFSPFVMPVYSYDSKLHDIVDETPLAKKLLYILVLGALWGSCMATFLYPVDIGVAVACSFLLIIAATVATTMTYIPLQLGRYASSLSTDNIIDAANVASKKFLERRLPLNLEMTENYYGVVSLAGDNNHSTRKTVEKKIYRTSLDIASELIDDTKSLTYVHDDSDSVKTQIAVDIDPYEENSVPWYKTYYTKLRRELVKLFELIPIGRMKGWKKHSESIFTPTDAMAEAIIAGRGPYGFLGVEGQLFKLFKFAQKHPRLAFLNQPWLNAYDEHGNSTKVVQLTERLDSMTIFTRYYDLDSELDHAFKEEFRCSVHFLLMLLVGADAKMQREQVLFQKFLRENRFRLASNGISPPSEIFSSNSFASINIPLTAVWLSTLTSEERERFQLLKSAFSSEQSLRDEEIDNADYKTILESNELKEERLDREKSYASRLKLNVTKIQMQKAQIFAESLNATDKAKFLIRRDLWMNNPDCLVDYREEELYSKFKEAYSMFSDEYMDYARQELADIEAAQKGARMGEYGRAYQYVDSEFPPGDHSIGDIQASKAVLGWRCAPGISEGVQLFSGGTDPDDVQAGVFNDNWLLSAISMLAAAGGVGDGGVDEQIMNLFVGHYAVDGEITFHTEVGGYCVRLFKQGFWNPIILDDLFPMQRKEQWTNENHGMATAHAKECNGLWVSLIEKAFAKFYGSYAALERGYVTQALEDMTGCEAECIQLSSAGRGVGKQTLWDTLLRYKKNSYIMGAGTGASLLVDKEIRDMGIVFNSAYTIYDIGQVDGHKLLKLRNPPGEHEEWKGDWGDNSPLWTKRLKHKLGLVENTNDNTFFMSFDDFCNVFRELYVCKWYNPKKWSQISYPGYWKKSDEAAIEKSAMMKQLMMQDGMLDKQQVDPEHEKREHAKARIDTAGGLPTLHNPGCILENNPHYSLRIYRPSEIRITVKQTDSRGHHTDLIKPFAIYIVRNAHPKVPMRLTKLDKENVFCCSGDPKEERVQYLYTTLPPGLYVVIVPAYVSGMLGHFSISLVANFRNDFQLLWPPKWAFKCDKGKAGGDAAGMSLLLDPGAKSNTDKKLDEMSSFVRKGMKLLFGASAEDEASDDEHEFEEGGDGDKSKVSSKVSIGDKTTITK